MLNPVCRLLALTVLASTALVAPAQITTSRDFIPASDDAVVEVLTARVPGKMRAAIDTPEAAATAAQAQIQLARSTADPRYLGRAQALLTPWWNRADAPTAIAILQATIEQSRHEFDAARATLSAALARDANAPQGWLTMATLERVAARYDAADAACQRVGISGAALYAAACRLETHSLQGKFTEARQGFAALLRQTSDAPTLAWLFSLLAESEERGGDDASAATSYKKSLALASDAYTSLALADLQLRTGKPADALAVLQQQPQSDGVILRQSYAYKQLDDRRWRVLHEDLLARFRALDARGEDARLHARELALAALWLEGDANKASLAADVNLQMQKEPIDWWLAVRSAKAAKRDAALQRVLTEVSRVGLRDARLML